MPQANERDIMVAALCVDGSGKEESERQDVRSALAGHSSVTTINSAGISGSRTPQA